VQSILQKKLDLEPLRIEDNRRDLPLVHSNLRGAGYYQNRKVQMLEPASEAASEPVTEGITEEVDSLKA
jgi:hypothetical protein